MKRGLLGIAALALLLVTTETAKAGSPWRVGVNNYGGGYYSYPAPGYTFSYGTRVGNNGFLSFNYSSGYSYGYPSYGYVQPYYQPVYQTPIYVGRPGFNNGWGWRR